MLCSYKLIELVFYTLFNDWSIFFCKQKTAYEMRISDWSSDVCSSDLYQDEVDARQIMSVPTMYLNGEVFGQGRSSVEEILAKLDTGADARRAEELSARERSEERRVGKECVGTCRSRWSQYHYTKNKSIEFTSTENFSKLSHMKLRIVIHITST